MFATSDGCQSKDKDGKSESKDKDGDKKSDGDKDKKSDSDKDKKSDSDKDKKSDGAVYISAKRTCLLLLHASILLGYMDFLICSVCHSKQY